MTASLTHVLPLTTIRRVRLLPAPGRVLVRPGQQVATNDPVAEVYMPDAHTLLDVRRALSIPSVSKAESLIQRRVGEKVQKGDIIAETGGMFSRVIRAPLNAVIVAITNAQVILETETTPLTLRAGMPGIVSEIIGDRGVIIENNGSLIQGVWGNGRADFGMLLVSARAPEDELTPDRLDISMRGAIVAGGCCSSASVLKAAAELPLRGLVLGSMSPELIPAASALKIPLLILEGFGRTPLSTPVYRLLVSSEKRDVSVNAAAWDRYDGERPEVVVPLPATGQTPLEAVEYSAGQTVRILGAPYAGQTGTLVALPPGLSLLPTGLRAPAGEVRLENGDKVIIPLVNLDVLE